MRSVRWLLAVVALLTFPAAGLAKVRAVSTDGEATVYLTGDFTGNFDISYDVRFQPINKNKSWSFISLLLLGRVSPGGSVGIGLSRGSPDQTDISGFTDVSGVSSKPAYKSYPLRCTDECTIELSGTQTAVTAFLNHRRVGTWGRNSLDLVRPYIQINGEVTAIGDGISARLTPVRAQIGDRTLHAPTCAFTTQGVNARGTAAGILTFGGRRDPNAGATYVSLLTGATGDTCHDALHAKPHD